MVVRVGDTVRRPSGPWTSTVHDLLRHVRARGFALAPEPLGWDRSGREILRFVPGRTVGWAVPWPAWIRSDEILDSVGRSVADFHRAVADFRPAGVAACNSGPAELGAGLIVCHNDLGPYNAVVDEDGGLAAFIDWDQAGPGPALSDLAFVAWQWVPLHGPFVASYLGWAELGAWPAGRALEYRAGRLRRLLDAYGLGDRASFVAAVEDRIRYNRSVMLERAGAGDPAYQALVDQGHVGGMDEALGYLTEVGPELQASIEEG